MKSGFHMNLRRAVAWSGRGEQALVPVIIIIKVYLMGKKGEGGIRYKFVFCCIFQCNCNYKI